MQGFVIHVDLASLREHLFCWHLSTYGRNRESYHTF
ncbi:hypothetical protein V6Z12_D12G135700 [Gossypium hirsutum]